MRLYFLRHADAVADGERPLSERGRKQMKTVVKALKRFELEFDAIYTSPLLRARETAEIVAEALGIEACVSDLLDSGANLADVAELLGDCAPDAKVMLVGHEPDFSMIVGELIGEGEVEMKKAGLALVECDAVEQGEGMLKWLLPPKVMG